MSKTDFAALIALCAALASAIGDVIRQRSAQEITDKQVGHLELFSLSVRDARWWLGGMGAIANYSLHTFGNPALSVSPAEVASMRRGGDAPLLITAMPYLLWGGGLLVLLLIVVLVVWRRRRAHVRALEAKRIALNRRLQSK